jgi:hypothetical protein
MENYSLSDIRAATGGEMDGFGGGWMWIIILFLFIFGIGGNGFGGNRGNEVQQGFDTAEITRKLDGLANGLCDGFYAQNTTMLNGFASITTAVRDAQFAAQQCCCETNRNIDAVRYEAAQNTCAIEKAIHAEGEATRNLIQQNEIQALRDKVADLQLAQSQCAQNAYLINQLRPCAVPAYLTCSPYASNCCQSAI